MKESLFYADLLQLTSQSCCNFCVVSSFPCNSHKGYKHPGSSYANLDNKKDVVGCAHSRNIIFISGAAICDTYLLYNMKAPSTVLQILQLVLKRPNLKKLFWLIHKSGLIPTSRRTCFGSCRILHHFRAHREGLQAIVLQNPWHNSIRGICRQLSGLIWLGMTTLLT